MITTRITDRFGLATPILNAGMAMGAGPPLAAAVSEAGGLGMLGGAMAPHEGPAAMIAATRLRTGRPFGIDLIGDFIGEDHLDVLIDEKVPLTVFFRTMPRDFEGVIDLCCRTAGQSVGKTGAVRPAAEIVHAMSSGATALARFDPLGLAA